MGSCRKKNKILINNPIAGFLSFSPMQKQWVTINFSRIFWDKCAYFIQKWQHRETPLGKSDKLQTVVSNFYPTANDYTFFA